MDLLKRELAPLSSKAWDEINKRAKDVLKSYLSARKVLNVNGPLGWNYTFVPEGRLLDTGENKTVKAMNYSAKPLTEARVEFFIDRWELDNLERGSKDPDLSPLEKAAKELALFEEKTIYNGNETLGIKGLKDYSKNNTVDVGKDFSDIMKAITDASLILRKNYENPPFALIAGNKFIERLNSSVHSYQLKKWLDGFIGSSTIFNHVMDDALLIPLKSDDLELTVGGDYSIGYQSHDDKKVRLFICESFTFRVLNPDIIVELKL